MKELLQGRRFGFAPRPALGFIAVGTAIALTLTDLMAWFAWGTTETNGYVVVAYFLAWVVALLCVIALLGAVAEYVDTPDEDRGLARLDIVATDIAEIALIARGHGVPLWKAQGRKSLGPIPRDFRPWAFRYNILFPETIGPRRPP